jgi:hypothetical protein
MLFSSVGKQFLKLTRSQARRKIAVSLVAGAYQLLLPVA